MYSNASVQQRWDNHVAVQLSLKRFTRGTKMEDLRGVLRVTKELGKGVYGVVYEATLIGKKVQNIAIKSVNTLDDPQNRETVLGKIMREGMAYAYLCALVCMNICPNFALVHRAFLTRHSQHNKMYCYLLVMEKADGNMKEWVHLQKDINVSNSQKWISEPHVLMSAVFQIFMAISACSQHINLVHNDLYLKNILYNRISKTTLVYHFRNRTYCLCDCEFLFKISDFGICSSPTHLDNEHNDMVLMTKVCRRVNSLLDLDFSNHILEYQNVDPYARDSIVFILSLLHSPDMHASCKTWLLNSLKYLDTIKLNDVSNLQIFISSIFSKNFLQKSGLSPHLFDPGVGGIDISAEHFHVNGNSDTNRDMITMARDNVDIGNSPWSGPSTPVPNSYICTPSTFF